MWPARPAQRLRWQRPLGRAASPRDTRPIRRSGRSLLTSGRCQRAPLAQLAEQRTLNPRVRGSSPWRRTRDDLGFYSSRSFFMCPVCPGSPPVLAPCLLVGRMLGPGWLVHFRRIGLDQPIGVPSDAVTERDNRRWRLAAGLAPWSSFLVAMESDAACGRTSAPPEPAVPPSGGAP